VNTPDWAGRYASEDTPWDLGRPHPELEYRRADWQLAPGATVLVPGCGRGHDALALAAAGMIVTAIDIVPEIGEVLSPRLEERGGRFLLGDALASYPGAGFDAIWEHTFFCALHPSQRSDYGDMVARVLRPYGRLLGVAFPADRPDDMEGPPYRAGIDELKAALGGRFRLIEGGPVSRPGAGRRWREQWFVFERA